MKKSKIVACLKILGIKPKMESFTDRKKMQKITYLLPVFDIDIGLDISSYNWYLHGPYSPKLTEAFFEMVENPNGIIVGELTKEETKKAEELRNFLGKGIESVDLLELLVSLHFLVYKAKEFGLGADAAVDFLKKKKPYFTHKEIQWALAKLKRLA